MSQVYELIGRAVVLFVRWRFGRQIRVAAAAGLGVAVLAALGAYVATRDGTDEES